MKAAPDTARLAMRERAALTSRQWVRLTRCCNNRCAFCLDTDAQDGTLCSKAEVLAEIEEGRRLDRQRLVLSGGEPTIHPQFLEFLRAGVAAGYERVQVITNGRMFARSDLLDAAVESGLGELTFSVHGHTSDLHDRLVGVPGAFVQTMRGLRNAVSIEDLIVNVDIVVCGPNVAFIDRIISLCQRIGIHEFDILQVQPSGRAAQDEEMLYDVEPALGSLRAVFQRSRSSDLFVWTNRFPVRHLEGFEELIQDPHKLVDEVRGRREQVETLFESGEPFYCRTIDEGRLCSSCFIEPLCSELHDIARRMKHADFKELLIDVRSDAGRVVPSQLRRSIQRTRVIARRLSDVRTFHVHGGQKLPGREVTLWLEEAEGLDAATSLEVGSLPVTRLASSSLEVLNAALDLKLEVGELEVSPDIENEPWLEAQVNLSTPQLVVRPAPRATLSDCLSSEIPPERLRELLARSNAHVEDIPYCLAGDRPVKWSGIELLPALFDHDGDEKIEHLVEVFAASRYRAKSVRCGRCADDTRCAGQQVQRLRAFGLRSLVPREQP